jgi:hypothetical protein
MGHSWPPLARYVHLSQVKGPRVLAASHKPQEEEGRVFRKVQIWQIHSWAVQTTGHQCGWSQAYRRVKTDSQLAEASAHTQTTMRRMWSAYSRRRRLVVGQALT